MEIVRIEFASAMGRAAAALRVAVFVGEQGVPAEMEIDEYDAGAAHFAAVAEGIVVGTFRVAEKEHEGKRAAKIGRVAVAREWRGKGVGRAMIAAAVDYARAQGFAECVLTAQVPVIGFYERVGFAAEGPAFDECGIAHRRMRMGLR